MLKHIGLWLVIMIILVQLSVVVSCKQQAEAPSEPSAQPETAPIPRPVPTFQPTIPPESPVSLNPPSFFRMGDLAAANAEVDNVETAATAYYFANGKWPSNTNTDLVNGGFLTEPAAYDYRIDSSGRVVVPDGTAWPNDSSITWSASEHKWRR